MKTHTKNDVRFLERFIDYLWFNEIIDNNVNKLMKNNIENYIEGEEYYEEAAEIYNNCEVNKQ